MHSIVCPTMHIRTFLDTLKFSKLLANDCFLCCSSHSRAYGPDWPSLYYSFFNCVEMCFSFQGTSIIKIRYTLFLLSALQPEVRMLQTFIQAHAGIYSHELSYTCAHGRHIVLLNNYQLSCYISMWIPFYLLSLLN